MCNRRGCTGECYNTPGSSAPKYNFVHSCVRITPNLERKLAHFLLAALQACSRDRLESVIMCYDNTKLRTHARTFLFAARPAYKSRKIRHCYSLTKEAHRSPIHCGPGPWAGGVGPKIPRQKRHLMNTGSHLVQNGVRCPFRQFSAGTRLTARHGGPSAGTPPWYSWPSQKLPVLRPQVTQGRFKSAGPPAARTCMFPMFSTGTWMRPAIS